MGECPSDVSVPYNKFQLIKTAEDIFIFLFPFE